MNVRLDTIDGYNCMSFFVCIVDKLLLVDFVDSLTVAAIRTSQVSTM